MKGAHVAGGGIGALVGLVIATVLRRYVGWTVTVPDATLIGSAALAAGAGLGHIWTTVGIVPSVRRGLFGPPAPKPVASAPPAPAPAPQPTQQ